MDDRPAPAKATLYLVAESTEETRQTKAAKQTVMVESTMRYHPKDAFAPPGWGIIPGLADTHHGEHAEFMAPDHGPITMRLRRPGRGDPVELVIGNGDHTCQVYQLTSEQLKSIARDAVLFVLD